MGMWLDSLGEILAKVLYNTEILLKSKIFILNMYLLDWNKNMSDTAITFILEEKKLRLSELLDYNKRLDKIILLYITAVYSVIGLMFSNKIDFSKLSISIDYTYFSFIFIFLNLSILLHAISQASFSMSLAKFIHTGINKDILKIIKDKNEPIPIYSLKWDDWDKEIKSVAVHTRDAVVGFWIVLVLGISIYSLKIINIKGFYLENLIQFWVIVIFLSLYLSYVIHQAILLKYFSSKFHIPSNLIKKPKILILLSSLLTILIICIATLVL